MDKRIGDIDSVLEMVENANADFIKNRNRGFFFSGDLAYELMVMVCNMAKGIRDIGAGGTEGPDRYGTWKAPIMTPRGEMISVEYSTREEALAFMDGYKLAQEHELMRFNHGPRS